ncbi:hypothetical protein [Rubripirellula tenax]|nr:hypothetical protein [Rubripirellula tenax]
MQSFAGRFDAALTGPIDRCMVSEALFNSPTKFGSLLVSRRMPDGRLCVVRMLIDGLCLGVKSVHPMFCYPAQLTELVENGPEDIISITPQAAKKLVEQAIDFAAKFGIEPAPGYRKVAAVFDGIDASECKSDFEFGRDGQPVFIAGPHDTDQRIGEITDKLSASVGEGNYTVEYDEAYGLDDELAGTSWTDDPELDADIDAD